MNTHQEYIYLNALEHILTKGKLRPDRTGFGRISVFGVQMRFDISKIFPALTTKKLAWKSVVSELLWFLEGTGNERRLAEIQYGTKEFTDKTRTIWTDNALDPKWLARSKFENFDLGPVYGVQWRSWPKPNGEKIDQIQTVIDNIQKDPYSARHVVSAWNVAYLEDMALPPCHLTFQFYVDTDGRLSCNLLQRSGDFFLGVPFNIASYSLLVYMVAQLCGLVPGELLHTITDAHIYPNHVEQVKEQIKREPLQFPTLSLNKSIININDFKREDIILNDYQSLEAIKAQMAT